MALDRKARLPKRGPGLAFRFHRFSGKALREVWRERRATSEDLHRYARVCRVENVMRPYMEALAG